MIFYFIYFLFFELTSPVKREFNLKPFHQTLNPSLPLCCHHPTDKEYVELVCGSQNNDDARSANLSTSDSQSSSFPYFCSKESHPLSFCIQTQLHILCKQRFSVLQISCCCWSPCSSSLAYFQISRNWFSQ